MTVAAFDTLRAAKRLKDLGFTETQAEGVADMLREARESESSTIADRFEGLALQIGETNHRLDLVRGDLLRAIADAKADVLKWLIPLLLGQIAVIAALVKLL